MTILHATCTLKHKRCKSFIVQRVESFAQFCTKWPWYRVNPA